MVTDPKKGKKKAATTPSKKNAALTDTQQLSDALAKKVSSGKISMSAAQAQQRAADKKAMKTKTIKNNTGKGTPKVAGSSFGKERKAKFRRNKKGNVEAY